MEINHPGQEKKLEQLDTNWCKLNHMKLYEKLCLVYQSSCKQYSKPCKLKLNQAPNKTKLPKTSNMIRIWQVGPFYDEHFIM